MVLDSRYRYDTGTSVLNLNKEQISIRDEIQNKIDSSEWELEEFKCSVCNEDDFELISEKGRYGIQIPVKICRNCGLVQSNPRMTGAQAAEFYEEYYRILYNMKEAIKDYQSSYNSAEKIYKYIDKNLEANLNEARVLEIGCGYGKLMNHFETKGCEIVGCDLDKEAIEFAQDHGLDAHFGDIRNLTINLEPDVIIMDDVLEHLIQPDDLIEFLSHEFPKEHYLYIEMPGIMERKVTDTRYNSDLLKYTHIAHTHHFSLHSLENLLGVSGYELVSGDETIRALFKSTGNSKYKIQNAYQQTIDHLQRLEKYRKLNNLYMRYWNVRTIHRHQYFVSFLKKTGLYPTAKKIERQITNDE